LLEAQVRNMQTYVPAEEASNLRDRLRKAEFGCEAERTKSVRLEAEVSSLRQTVEEQLDELCKAREAARDCEAAHRRDKEKWMEDDLERHLAESRQQVSQLTARVEKLEGQLQSRVTEIDELHGEIADRQKRLVSAASVARQQTEAADADARAAAELRQENAKVREENQKFKEQTETLLLTQREREAKLQKLLKEHAEAVTKEKSLLLRLNRIKKLERINVAQFEGLMSTNLKVAQNIQSLVTTISDEDKPKDEQAAAPNAPAKAETTHPVMHSISQRRHDGLSPRSAAHAVHEAGDDNGVAGRIRRNLRRLYEALDYLDSDKSGLVRVDELLGELEGLGISTTPTELRIPEDPSEMIDYVDFIRKYAQKPRSIPDMGSGL